MLTRDSVTTEINQCKEMIQQLDAKAPSDTLVKTHNFYGSAIEVCLSLQVLLEKTVVPESDKQKFYSFISDTLRKVKDTVITPSYDNIKKCNDVFYKFIGPQYCFMSIHDENMKKSIFKHKLKKFLGIGLLIAGICLTATLPLLPAYLGLAICGCIVLSLYPSYHAMFEHYLSTFLKEDTHIHISDYKIEKHSTTDIFDRKIEVDEPVMTNPELISLRNKLSFFSFCSNEVEKEQKEHNLHTSPCL